MAIVNSTTTINAPVDSVYAVAQDVERFPSYMPNVKSIEIVERAGDRVVTKWVGEVEDLRRNEAGYSQNLSQLQKEREALRERVEKALSLLATLEVR